MENGLQIMAVGWRIRYSFKINLFFRQFYDIFYLEPDRFSKSFIRTCIKRQIFREEKKLRAD